jgi:hypothetical protein
MFWTWTIRACDWPTVQSGRSASSTQTSMRTPTGGGVGALVGFGVGVGATVGIGENVGIRDGEGVKSGTSVGLGSGEIAAPVMTRVTMAGGLAVPSAR